jgi:replicative DNA helicase
MTQNNRHLTAMERVLPNSMEAESAVLGAMFLSANAADDVMDRISAPEMFYYAAHQTIYRELCDLITTTRSSDLVVITSRLSDKGLLAGIGGAAYLTDLISKCPSASNVGHYIAIVVQKHLLRSLIDVSHGVINESFDNTNQAEEVLAQTIQKVQALAEENIEGGFVESSQMVKAAMDSIEKMMGNKGALTGLASGFRDLDKLTCGFKGGEMIVIAARPSMGKTSLAMNIAEHVAIDQGLPVGVFSLEMSKEQLMLRMISSRARVNIKKISEGYVAEREFPKLQLAASEIGAAPLYIDDTAALSISKMRSRAHRLAKTKNIKLLVIDYAQLMKAPCKQSENSRQVEVALISQGVKQIAKELRIPVILIAQLNRKPDEREAGLPKLSDLRESGQLEQDADVVGLLVRPEMNLDDKDQKEAAKGKAVLIIAKNRDGAVGEVQLTFIHECTRFENVAMVDSGDYPHQ